MKKTFLTLIAITTMLFAFTSCDALLGVLNNLDNQGNNNTEQQDDENEPADTGDSSIKSIADLTGKSFIYYEDSFQNQYIYFKDASTVVFCLKDSSGNWKTEECSINENGRFDSKILKHSVTVKVIDGNVLFYKNQINADGIDENANVKKDGSEGLVGTWVYSGYASPFEYTVTEKTISLDDVVTKDYTYKNGILYVDGKVGYYFDGKNLYTEGVQSPEKVSDTALETEIKKQAGVKDKDDEGGTEPAAIKIDDVVGNVYFLQQRPDAQINDIQVNLYYIDDSTTITQFYQNSSYNDNDLPMKNMINAIKDDVINISYSYYSGDQNRIETDTKALSYAVYDNSIIAYDTGDSFPLTKTSGGDGLYGTWEVSFEYYQWGEYHTKTVKLEIDETTANSEKYTNDNGFISIKHGEGMYADCENFYYDGKTVYRDPFKLAKVNDVRKIRAIKSELGVLEKDPVPQNVNDLIGKYYFFQVNPRYTHDNHSRNAAFYMHVNSDLSVDFYQIREDWDLLASKEGTYNLEGDTIPTTCFYSPLKIRFTSNNVFCCKENSDREPEAYEKVDGKEGLIGEWKGGYEPMVIEEENGVLFYTDRWRTTYEITNDDGFLTVRNKEDGDGNFWYYDGEKIYTESEYCMNLLQVFDKETIDLLDNTTEQVLLFR